MNKIFVYGILKPGHQRWDQITRYVISARKSTANGTLYDTGFGWPAATFPGHHQIPGWTVKIHDDLIGDTLETLDHIEGVQHGLFERITVSNEKGEQCWTYHWPQTTEGFAQIGGW